MMKTGANLNEVEHFYIDKTIDSAYVQKLNETVCFR